MRRLDPVQKAAAKRAARCPDCDSDVTIDEATDPPTVSIAHDDGCPMLGSLKRQGRTSSLALVRGPGQSPRAFAEDVLAVAQAAAAEIGPIVVRTSAYEGGLGTIAGGTS